MKRAPLAKRPLIGSTVPHPWRLLSKAQEDLRLRRPEVNYITLVDEENRMAEGNATRQAVRRTQGEVGCCQNRPQAHGCAPRRDQGRDEAEIEKAMTLPDLIKTLEAATGPSIKLNAAIAVQVGGRGWPSHYTSRIDVAASIVPKGWSWSLSVNENKQYPCADLGRSHPTNKRVTVEAPTPALALVIAALKAKQGMTE